MYSASSGSVQDTRSGSQNLATADNGPAQEFISFPSENDFDDLVQGWRGQKFTKIIVYNIDDQNLVSVQNQIDIVFFQ